MRRQKDVHVSLEDKQRIYCSLHSSFSLKTKDASWLILDSMIPFNRFHPPKAAGRRNTNGKNETDEKLHL